MKMIDDYFNKERTYKDKYGPKTFLLYQVGSFFEVYGINQGDQSETIQKFSEVCGLSIAPKQSGIGRKNVLMAGFRDYLLDKYIEQIHPHGYTIVVYTQEVQKDGVTIERKESGIYSPGTTITDNVSVLSNNISCVWIQKTKKTSICGEKFIFGLSNINVFNGNSNLCEYFETYYHNPTSYDSIEKFLNIYSPIETIIIHNLEDSIICSIVDFLQMKCKKYHVIDLANKTHELSTQALNCESQVYQNEIIKTYFPSMNYEVFKYNVSDKPISLQSYCFLLNFVRQHNVCLIDKISEPNIEQAHDILVCANHSLKQLNIIDDNVNYYDKDGKISSVLSILNQCITKMGKRAMNDIVLNPTSNHDNLTKDYNTLEYIFNKKYTFDSYLRQIKDIDRILMKFKLQRVSPSDICSLYESCVVLEDIYEYLKGDKKSSQMFSLVKCGKESKKLVKYINSCLDVEVCQQISQCNFDRSDETTRGIIKQDYSPKLDAIIKEQNMTRLKLTAITDYLESQFSKKDQSKFIQYHYTPSNELCLLLTKKRAKTLVQALKKIGKDSVLLECKDEDGNVNRFPFSIDSVDFKDYNKQKSILYSVQLDELVSSIYNNSIEINEMLTTVFQSIVSKMYKDYFKCLTIILETIKKIDIINAKCILARKYNLCKPKIVKTKNSFVDAKKMRHILIETLEKNEIYVPNDVCIGNQDDNLGILLFGTNAVGKTSLIKALGICVVMAQSGFFVPCESFEYCPYKYIFTRIIGNDNIFKGLSTFGVEMSELRVILNNCDSNSLILGDELCSGTETDSALSIFNASLEVMSERKSSFIFATHFHELPHLKTMKSLTSVKCKHLKVQFDHESQSIYYDRKIYDGQGESVYGLEVCKSLRLPDKFLDRCYKIRNDYLENKDNILCLKTSKYNKDKIRNICEFCNQKLGTEIHHLQYQCDANDNEYIDNSFHKNHSANLSSICNECHTHIHGLNLRYEKRKTINGNYEFILKKN